MILLFLLCSLEKNADMAADIVNLDLHLDELATANSVALIRDLRAWPLGTGAFEHALSRVKVKWTTEKDKASNGVKAAYNG